MDIKTKLFSRFHYAWVIAVCCFFISGGGVGILINTLGTFIKPVSDGLGVPRAEFSLVTSFSSLSTMLTYTFWGKYLAKHSIRKTIIINGALISAFIVGYSLCVELWQFYICGIFIGALTGSMSILAVTTIINNWFEASRGVATGISSCGSGLAMLFIPLVSSIIVSQGWRNAYLFVGLLLFLLIEIVAVFFLRDRPEEKGLKAYGADSKAASATVAESAGVSLAQTKAMKSFKLIVIIGSLSALCNTAITHHIYAFVTDLGHSASYASWMSSLQMLSMMVSKLILGYVFDRTSLKTGLMISILGYAVCALCLIFSGISSICVIIAVICAGIGAAMPAMSMAYSLRKLYGKKEYSAITGFFLSFTYLGNTIGTSLSGVVFDITGGYTLAWAIILAISMIMAICLEAALKAYSEESELQLFLKL